MYVTLNCPKCNQELEVEKSMVGEQIECPTCSEVLTIPDGSQAPPPPPSPLGRVNSGGHLRARYRVRLELPRIVADSGRRCRRAHLP